MKTSVHVCKKPRMGFTLTELMVTVGIFSIVMAGMFPVYLACRRMWARMDLDLETTRRASSAMTAMVYGTGNNAGLRGARDMIMATNAGGWTLQYTDVEDKTNRVVYDLTNGTITATPGPFTIGKYVTSASLVPVPAGVNVLVEVRRTNGRYSSSCSLSSYVSFRNRE
jgi:prepilin-type N-terminal cleavage/methylation domain-containing protein